MLRRVINEALDQPRRLYPIAMLNRSDMAWFALAPVVGFTYIPSWIEVMIQLGVIRATMVAFALAARYLPLFGDPAHGIADERLPQKPARVAQRAG